MNYPKIVFKPISLEDNIELVKWAYYENNGSISIHDYLLNYFPKLKMINASYSKEKINLFIEETVKEDYYLYYERIISETERYNNIWKKYNDSYLKALSKYLNISFSDNIEIIYAYVGLTPTYPRDLDTSSFTIGTGLNENDIVRITAHELCHFLWFIKWKELYPNTTREEFDSPYLPWKYSEMVVDPILNSKEIYEILKVHEKAYDSFYEIKDINGVSMMNSLIDIYNSNEPIEKKIKLGYEYILTVLK